MTASTMGLFDRWIADNKPVPMGRPAILVREWNGSMIRFQVFEVFDHGLNEGTLRRFGVRWPVQKKRGKEELDYKTVYVNAETPEEALEMIVGKTADGHFTADNEGSVVTGGMQLANGGAMVRLQHPDGKAESKQFGPDTKVSIDGQPATWDKVYLGYEWIVGGRYENGNVMLDLEGSGDKKRQVELPPSTKIEVDGKPGTWRDVKARMLIRCEEDVYGTTKIMLHRNPGDQHKQMQARIKDGPDGSPIAVDFSTEPVSYLRDSMGGSAAKLANRYEKMASRPKLRGEGMTKGWPKDSLRPEVFEIDDADKVMGQRRYRNERGKMAKLDAGHVYDGEDLTILSREYLRLAQDENLLQMDVRKALKETGYGKVGQTDISGLKAAWNAYLGSVSRRRKLYADIEQGIGGVQDLDRVQQLMSQNVMEEHERLKKVHVGLATAVRNRNARHATPDPLEVPPAKPASPEEAAGTLRSGRLEAPPAAPVPAARKRAVRPPA